MAVKNIIFDLGGVILNLAPERTIQALQSLGATDVSKIYSPYQENPLLDTFEIGGISIHQFREEAKKVLGIQADDSQFDQAWNAMLLDIPQERLEFIETLKQRFKIFLFSNINAIHLEGVLKIYEHQTGERSLAQFFHREYYSCLFKRRKPTPESYKAILSENNIDAHDTLFVDDHLGNIEGANKVGMQTFHIATSKNLFDIMTMLN